MEISMAKRRKGEQRQGTCIYCGVKGPIEDDHVFPRQWFLVKDPQMITVPACRGCQEFKALGDDDLLVAACISYRDGDHPDLLRHIEKIARHPRKAKWLKRAMAEALSVPETNDAGGLMGYGLAIPFNFHRIEKTLPMMIRGLFYTEKIRDRMLPISTSVDAYLIPEEGRAEYVRRMTAIRRDEPRFKGNTIAWWVPFFPDDADDDTSAFLVCVFDKFVIQGTTGQLAERMIKLRSLDADAKPQVEGLGDSIAEAAEAGAMRGIVLADERDQVQSNSI